MLDKDNSTGGWIATGASVGLVGACCVACKAQIGRGIENCLVLINKDLCIIGGSRRFLGFGMFAVGNLKRFYGPIFA